MGRLRSWLRLTAAERRTLAAATLAVAGARVLLWVLPNGAVAALLRPASRTGAARRSSTADGIAREVKRAARLVPGANCLVQALQGSG